MATKVLDLPSPISSSSTSHSWANLFNNSKTTNLDTSVLISLTNSVSVQHSSRKSIIEVATANSISPPSTPESSSAFQSCTNIVGNANTTLVGSSSTNSIPIHQSPRKLIAGVIQEGPAPGLTATPDPAPASASTSAPRHKKIEKHSYKLANFLTKSETDFTASSLRSRGLTNPSNYCFINSILQALMGCAPFYNLIRSIPKQLAARSAEVSTPTISTIIQFASEFSSLPLAQQLPLKRELRCDPSFRPIAICKLWKDSRQIYAQGRQEDAEEFLSYVLNKLNDEMWDVMNLIRPPIIDQNGNQQTPAPVKRTPLSDIFQGEVRSRLEREGEPSSDSYESFFTLQLNVKNGPSVTEALANLTAKNRLEGVTSSNSKQEVIAWQQMALLKLPAVLILHLKCFEFKYSGSKKILKTLEYPLELNIDPSILTSNECSEKQRSYRLFAVVYHDGRDAFKGHYFTDVYHSGYKRWLRCNDSIVEPISEQKVLRPTLPCVPYLLYYRRCDTISDTSLPAIAK